MKRFIYLILIFLSFSLFPSVSIASISSLTNEELVIILQLAVENCNDALIKEVVSDLYNQNLSNEKLSALSKYNENGKLDFALHSAIKNHDVIAAIILAFYSKDIDKRESSETVWTSKNGTGKSGCNRQGKNPLELAFWHEMPAIVPYLIHRGSDIYQMRGISFVFEGEEDLNFIKDIFPNALVHKKTCIETKKTIIATSHGFKRNFIGDAIAKNRLDIIEMVGKRSVNWNSPCLEFESYKLNYSPLQYALLLKRNEIALYLIVNGAVLE